MRGKFLKARQMITAVDNCKIEKFENNWWTLSFFDVISQSDVKIRRRAGSVRILGPDDKTVDIHGFEGFTNRPKRVRTKRADPVKVPMNLDQYEITRVDPNYYALGKPYTPAFGGAPFPVSYEPYQYRPADKIVSLLAEASEDATVTTNSNGFTMVSTDADSYEVTEYKLNKKMDDAPKASVSPFWKEFDLEPITQDMIK